MFAVRPQIVDHFVVKCWIARSQFDHKICPTVSYLLYHWPRFRNFKLSRFSTWVLLGLIPATYFTLPHLVMWKKPILSEFCEYVHYQILIAHIATGEEWIPGLTLLGQNLKDKTTWHKLNRCTYLTGPIQYLVICKVQPLYKLAYYHSNLIFSWMLTKNNQTRYVIVGTDLPHTLYFWFPQKLVGNWPAQNGNACRTFILHAKFLL